MTDVSQIFLNIATTDETFQNSGDPDSFRYKLKNSANIYESSGSLFFRITTGILRKSRHLWVIRVGYDPKQLESPT